MAVRRVSINEFHQPAMCLSTLDVEKEHVGLVLLRNAGVLLYLYPCKVLRRRNTTILLVHVVWRHGEVHWLPSLM